MSGVGAERRRAFVHLEALSELTAAGSGTGVKVGTAFHPRPLHVHPRRHDTNRTMSIVVFHVFPSCPVVAWRCRVGGVRLMTPPPLPSPQSARRPSSATSSEAKQRLKESRCAARERVRGEPPGAGAGAGVGERSAVRERPERSARERPASAGAGAGAGVGAAARAWSDDHGRGDGGERPPRLSEGSATFSTDNAGARGGAGGGGGTGGHMAGRIPTTVYQPRRSVRRCRLTLSNPA